MVKANASNFLEAQADKEAIKETLYNYCRGVDRKDFNLMESAYHADAYDDHGSYKGDRSGLMEWVRGMHEDIEQSVHMLSNCFIELRGDVAAVESFVTTHQRFAPHNHQNLQMYGSAGSIHGDQRLQVMAVARYVDRFEKRDGDWRIAHRVCVLETVWTRIVESTDGFSPWVISQRDETDALWRIREGVLN